MVLLNYKWKVTFYASSKIDLIPNSQDLLLKQITLFWGMFSVYRTPLNSCFFAICHQIIFTVYFRKINMGMTTDFFKKLHKIFSKGQGNINFLLLLS